MYTVGEKVLLDKGDVKTKFAPKYEGPYEIVEVKNNGSVRMCEGAVTDTVNIGIITPYRE